MVYKEYKNDSYNLYTIKTDNFKTCCMEIVFYNKFDKNKITEMNMLSYLLSFSSKKYYRHKLVVEKRQDLYSDCFNSSSVRIGNIRCLKFHSEFINPVYANKRYLSEVIKFPFEMIFNPNISNGAFDLKSFNICKNENIANIESVKEFPVQYSLKRSLKVMNDKHPASFDMVGYLDDLDKITPESMVKTYNDVIKYDKCDIYVTGNLNMDDVAAMIKDCFKIKINNNNKYDLFVNVDNSNKVRNVEEHEDFKQATLSMIFDTNKFSKFERNYVMGIFNIIFGTGSLNSKLYQNLREKNSLCYSVNSMYKKYDQLLIVYSGIDAKNKDKAVKLIQESLNEMVTGNFSDDDLKNGIKLMKNNIDIFTDDQANLMSDYFFHNLGDIDLIQDYSLKVDAITKNDIIALAKKIKLNTIYIMIPGGKNEEN